MSNKKIHVFSNKDKERQGEKESWKQNRHNLALFPHPARILFCSPPGRGKTNLMKQLICETQMSAKPYLKIIIVCPSVNKEWEDLGGDVTIYNSLLDFKPQDIDPTKKGLLILDDIDLGSPSKSEKKQLSEIFRYVSSHMGITCFVSYQSFYDIPTILRKTCQTFFIWRPVSSLELSTISNRLGADPKIIRAIFDNICTDVYDSLCVDLSVGGEFAKYRKNIYDIIQIEE